MEKIKRSIATIDKNMSDIPRWIRRTSAISSGIITGALIFGACGPNGPETTQVNASGESENNNNSSEQSSSIENLTQEQIAQRTLDNFVAKHPEYKDREAGVVNFIINGVDASTVVFETTEAEKTEISERKYVIEGDEVTPFTGAIVWTKETDFDGNERWVRLAGVQFQNEGDTTETIYTVWYSSPYEDYTKVSTNVDFKRKVFAFNSNDDEYAYWPQVNPPTKIVWSDDMTQTDPSRFEVWNGNDPFILPVKQLVEGGSKSLFAPAAIESPEPASAEFEAYKVGKETRVESNYNGVAVTIDLIVDQTTLDAAIKSGGKEVKLEGVELNPDFKNKYGENSEEALAHAVLYAQWRAWQENVTEDVKSERQNVSFDNWVGMVKKAQETNLQEDWDKVTYQASANDLTTEAYDPEYRNFKPGRNIKIVYTNAPFTNLGIVVQNYEDLKLGTGIDKDGNMFLIVGGYPRIGMQYPLFPTGHITYLLTRLSISSQGPQMVGSDWNEFAKQEGKDAEHIVQTLINSEFDYSIKLKTK